MNKGIVAFIINVYTQYMVYLNLKDCFSYWLISKFYRCLLLKRPNIIKFVVFDLRLFRYK